MSYKSYKRHKKGQTNLDNYQYVFVGGRLLRGYVRESASMAFFAALPILMLIAAILLLIHSYYSVHIPPTLIQTGMLVEDIKLDEFEFEVEFVSNNNSYTILSSAITNIEELTESFVPGEYYVLEYDADDPNELWGITTQSGMCYAIPEATLSAMKNNHRQVISVCLFVMIVYIAILSVGAYILFHAQRYPRLARLFVRKEFLTIKDRERTD